MILEKYSGQFYQAICRSIIHLYMDSGILRTEGRPSDQGYVEKWYELYFGNVSRQHRCGVIRDKNDGEKPTRHGEGEKRKYLDSCLLQCQPPPPPPPFVVSVEGLLGN